MRVLTVYAHHHPRSLCHAILQRFTEGLRDAGHTGEVVDLHALRFDPVLRDRDQPNWIDDSVPDDVLEHMDVKRALIEGARNPLRRLMVKRWIGDRDARDIVRRLRSLGPPRDVAEQQAKVAQADALAFIAPTTVPIGRGRRESTQKRRLKPSRAVVREPSWIVKELRPPLRRIANTLLRSSPSRTVGRQPHHSITSSARSSNVCGIFSPSDFAVRRLITRSNFVGCSTGRSLGLAPLMILLT
jgi:Flavodoxin-like fold